MSHTTKSVGAFIAVFMSCVVIGLPARAATMDDEDVTSLVRIEYWNFNVDGHAVVHGSETNVDDTDRLINRANGGFVLYGDKRFMSAGVNVDLFVGRERLSQQLSNSESANFEADYTIFTLNGYLPLVDRDFQKPETYLKLDVLAGLRGYMNSYKLEFNPYDQYNSKNRSDAVSWVDACVGLRLAYQISPRFGLEAYGDAGGFGIGSGSELSALGRANALFTLKPQVNLVAGYRVFDLKSGEQSGDRQTELDLQMQGITFGVEGRF